MKKVPFLCMFMAISIVSLAHFVTPQCQMNGRFKFQGTFFPTTGKVRVTIVDAQGNPTGAFDTTFNSTSSISFSVPKPSNANVRIRVRSQNNSGNSVTWEGFSQTTSSVCSTLPLVFNSFTVEKISNTEALVTAKVSSVESVDRVEVRVSIDGKEFRTVATFKPDNTASEKTYTAIIKLK